MTAVPNEDANYPPRDIRWREVTAMHPFGDTTALNSFEYFQGTPEIVNNVISCSMI